MRILIRSLAALLLFGVSLAVSADAPRALRDALGTPVSSPDPANVADVPLRPTATPIESALKQARVLGLHKHPALHECWKYVDVEASASAGGR